MSSVTQASRGPIMSVKENNCTSEGKDSSIASSSTRSKSLVKHSSPLNTPVEVRKLETSKAESRPKTTGADKTISTDMNETGAESTGNSCASSSESMASSCSGARECTAPSEETRESSSNADNFSSRDNSGELEFLPSLLPSDVALDTLLKDITGGAPTSVSNDMMPIDVSEIIHSLEDLPNERASSSETADLSRGTVTIASESACGDSVIATGSETPQSAGADGDSSSRSRRQSPRKLPSSSVPTPAASLTEDLPQTSSGTALGFLLANFARSRWCNKLVIVVSNSNLRHYSKMDLCLKRQLKASLQFILQYVTMQLEDNIRGLS